ncbi:MAG: CDP-glycerol glycerophosphotransferase family protein [Eubacterium sp.]|nr:CDP-glycerol glycerophosphotransferase family protein [Eubacterium sp.]
MKITIIIPYWREEEYLRHCLDSVREEHIDSLEILLVADQGPVENPLPDWISEVDGLRLITMPERTEGTWGVAACRNRGLEEAQGDYVYFLDSDDYLCQGGLSKLLETAEEKDALLVTGNIGLSWYSPVNLEANPIYWESQISGLQKMEGNDLFWRFKNRFSANHLFIKRQLLTDQALRFQEDTRLYTDESFVAKLLLVSRNRAYIRGDASYISRRRNDQVHLPALSQGENAGSPAEFVVQYNRCEKILEGDMELTYILHRHLLDYAISHFPKCRDMERLGSCHQKLSKIQNYKEFLSSYSFWQRRVFMCLRKGHYKLARRMSQINTVMTKKDGLFGSKIQWYRVLEHFIFKKMPVKKNWILFQSFFGKSYSDSPKYLYEYLQKTYGDKYRYIWILNGKSQDLKKTGKHKVCKLNSLAYVYYTARCGYRIFNVRQAGWCKKRPGVKFLETWHGTPLKKLGFDLGDLYTTNQRLKSVFYEQGQEWDYLTSANPFSTETFARCFGVPREKIIETGYPRNDILYADNKEEIAREVKRELGIPEGKRVIMYAPTWRDNQMIRRGQYKFSLAMDLDLLQREFGRDSVLLLRAHYYIADMMDFSQYQGFVYNASRYEDVSRLYLASDLCITDYSSVFFDYANLKRPILFFAYDYEAYADEIRGMYLDMEKDLPGPIIKTNQELVEALHHLDQVEEKYRDRYRAFYDRFCGVDDGHACQRTVEIMFEEKEN